MHENVVSANLRCCGWSEGTLTVTFNNGREYHYHGVPEAVYGGMVAAGSKGRFFHQNVRPIYPHCSGGCAQRAGTPGLPVGRRGV